MIGRPPVGRVTGFAEVRSPSERIEELLTGRNKPASSIRDPSRGTPREAKKHLIAGPCGRPDVVVVDSQDLEVDDVPMEPSARRLPSRVALLASRLACHSSG